MTIHEAIAHLARQESLTRDAAGDLMRELMSGAVTAAQAAAVLTALYIKGETVEELTGFAETMRQLVTPVRTNRRPLVDTCGTGGDHSCTFNISTAAAFVVAGAGVAVAKHGNRSASSKCGSADVLEALGVQLEVTPARVGAMIDNIGIGFLFARNLHDSMRHVAPVRADLKIRTVFNLLGPLTNPAGADGQVVGVFSPKWVRPIAEVLAALGARHAFVVAGRDGLDELTLDGTSAVAEVSEKEIEEYEIDATELGLRAASKEQLRGDSPDLNARLLRDVLDGLPGPRRDITLLNAAPAILAGGNAQDWPGALGAAALSIDTGAARAKLEQMIEYSHDS